MDTLAKQALAEYSSAITTAHHGGAHGRPFWNVCASQFMFNPCFQFAEVPGCARYRFTAVDVNGVSHSFESENVISLLTPIWGDIPEGITQLRVEALNEKGEPWALAGARSFYRCAPFTGDYPPAARGYRECAMMAYDYAFSQPFMQHWLQKGTPDPEYDLNVYPSKMVSRIIPAMLRYRTLRPERAVEALQLAVNAADYLLSITFPADAALPHIPPTYHLGFREHPEDYNNETAVERIDQMMTIYAADVGASYLLLEEATGDGKYYAAARAIADWFREQVLENGSWPLILDVHTGESLSPNCCVPDTIMEFMQAMHARTGEPVWQELAEGCYTYMVEHCLKPYNWEGQFEDSVTSTHYSNLTHFAADAMIRHITAHKAGDPWAMAEAEDLLRFVEDQFVVWGRPAPWNRHPNNKNGNDISQWYYPAGLEQYNWYMPIDSSTAAIMQVFLRMYQVTGRPLLLAKARALGDMITRMQNPRTGLIPTHWMRRTCIEDGGNLWINCLFMTANTMFELAEATE